MKISNKIKTLGVGVGSVVLAGLKAGTVSAVKFYCPGTNKESDSLEGCDDVGDGDQNKNDLNKMISTIINVVIGVVGFVAVVVIILGGVQYTTSAGDPGKVKKAKDTILYGIVGLVVALLAYAIVNFVLGALQG